MKNTELSDEEKSAIETYKTMMQEAIDAYESGDKALFQRKHNEARAFLRTTIKPIIDRMLARVDTKSLGPDFKGLTFNEPAELKNNSDVTDEKTGEIAASFFRLQLGQLEPVTEPL